MKRPVVLGLGPHRDAISGVKPCSEITVAKAIDGLGVSAPVSGERPPCAE
jgi:hypothetical protein